MPGLTYSVREAALLMRMSESTLYDQARTGRLDPRLHALRCGTKTIFPRRHLNVALGFDPDEDLTELIKEREGGAPDAA